MWAGPPESVTINLEHGFGAEFLALLNHYNIGDPSRRTGVLATWPH